MPASARGRDHLPDAGAGHQVPSSKNLPPFAALNLPEQLETSLYPEREYSFVGVAPPCSGHTRRGDSAFLFVLAPFSLPAAVVLLGVIGLHLVVGSYFAIRYCQGQTKSCRVDFAAGYSRLPPCVWNGEFLQAWFISLRNRRCSPSGPGCTSRRTEEGSAGQFRSVPSSS